MAQSKSLPKPKLDAVAWPQESCSHQTSQESCRTAAVLWRGMVQDSSWSLCVPNLQLQETSSWSYCCQRRVNQLLNPRVYLLIPPCLVNVYILRLMSTVSAPVMEMKSLYPSDNIIVGDFNMTPDQWKDRRPSRSDKHYFNNIIMDFCNSKFRGYIESSDPEMLKSSWFKADRSCRSRSDCWLLSHNPWQNVSDISLDIWPWTHHSFMHLELTPHKNNNYLFLRLLSRTTVTFVTLPPWP